MRTIFLGLMRVSGTDMQDKKLWKVLKIQEGEFRDKKYFEICDNMIFGISL